MHFLNPGAFWALFLVAIPILIHLFNLRRIKKIYFSNLSFLRDVKQQQKSRSTLKKLLILACRIFTIFFLVLAFSRPVFISADEPGLSSSSIIYLDNSLSLQRTDASGNLLLVNAVSAVEGILSELPKESEAGIITNDRALVRLFPVDRVLEDLQKIDYSRNSVQLGAVSEQVKRVQGDEVWIFSDLQRTTTLPLDPLLEDTSRKIIYYHLTSPIDRNLYVDTVFLQKPLGISSANILTIGVKNTGSEQVNDALLKVFKGEQQFASFTVSIGAGSVETIDLEVGTNSSMDGDYRIEIDDSPVVFDNIFFFSINASDRPLIVLLSESGRNSYIESVYSNTDYFQVISTSVNNTSFQDIARADLLVLDQLQTIPEWLLSQVGNVDGNILLIPAESIDRGSYSGVLGFPVNVKGTSERVALDPQSLDGPFLDGVFNQKNERMSLPEAAVKYVPSGYFQPLISTLAKEPFLVESGIGNVFFLTTPLLDSNTNFQQHALFVPVMYKLTQSRDVSRLAYRLDEQMLVVKADSVGSQTIVKLVNKHGTFVPSVRHLNDRMILELPDVLSDPGIYYLVAEEDTLRSFALNYNKAESEIASVDPDEFLNIVSGYEHVQLQNMSDVEEFVSQMNSSRGQETLWKYALFLALFFVMSELLLLRFI